MDTSSPSDLQASDQPSASVPDESTASCDDADSSSSGPAPEIGDKESQHAALARSASESMKTPVVINLRDPSLDNDTSNGEVKSAKTPDDDSSAEAAKQAVASPQSSAESKKSAVFSSILGRYWIYVVQDTVTHHCNSSILYTLVGSIPIHSKICWENCSCSHFVCTCC